MKQRMFGQTTNGQYTGTSETMVRELLRSPILIFLSVPRHISNWEMLYIYHGDRLMQCHLKLHG